MTAEVYRAAGRDHGRARPAAGRGRRGRLVAGLLEQRGGARHADARDRARGLHARARTSRISLDIAASEFGRDGPLPARPRQARARQRRRSPKCCSAGATAIRSSRSRTRSPRTTTEGLRRVHRGGRRPRAGDRRRLPRHRRGPVAEGGAARARQRGADQGQPGRDGHRGQGRARRGARGRASARSSRPARARPRT